MEDYQGDLELLMLFVAGRKLSITLGSMATEQRCVIRGLRIEEQNSLECEVTPERGIESERTKERGGGIPCSLHGKWSSKHNTLDSLLCLWVDFHCGRHLWQSYSATRRMYE